MKKSFLLILLFIIVTSIQSYSTPETVRGVWMYSATLTTTSADTIVAKLSTNNVAQVYILVKGSNGVLADSTLLANFITAAHKKGIEVHFWYGVSQDAAFMASHPDAVIYHCPKPGTNNNKPYPMTGDALSRLNFLYPGYKDHVMNNITYLLKNFDCDGIHLDNIRYHHLVYSFDEQHVARATAAGCNTTRLLQLFIDNYTSYSGAGWIAAYVGGDEDVVKWVNMRKDVIKEYLSSVKALIQQHKPGIELSASFTPELNNDAMTHYSQDYSVCTPVLDRVMPTAFVTDYSQGTSWVKTVIEGVKALADTGCMVTSGLQVSTGMTPEVLGMAINNAIEGGTCGIVTMRYELITDAQWTKMKDIFDTVLPVELTSFAASVSGNKVTLNWKTVTESNNQGFEVERRSENQNWKTVGYVRGSGTTSEPKTYSYVDNISAGKYSYRLKQVDFSGTYSYSNEVSVNSAAEVKTYSLSQNYPNPFNPTTTIQFQMPEAGHVTLKVFNILGSEIKTVMDGNMEAGFHTINFDASNLPSGIYLYQLNANDFTSVKRMLLTK